LKDLHTRTQEIIMAAAKKPGRPAKAAAKPARAKAAKKTAKRKAAK
jgi:hypothetical protein